MMVEYFDLPNDTEVTVQMFWPMQPVHCEWMHQTNEIRIYYVVLPGCEEEEVDFFIAKSDQVLPSTFPGKHIGTVIPENLDERDDAALHIFIAPPPPKKEKRAPLIVKRPNKDKKPPTRKKATGKKKSKKKKKKSTKRRR